MAYDLIKISALPETTPDESQDIVIGDGDYAKRIKYADVKADMVGTSPSYTTDTEPYLMRQTAHVGVVGKCALEKLVGGSLGWNQLVPKSANSETTSGVTFTNNNDGTWSVSGTTTSGNVFSNLDYVAGTKKYINGHVYAMSGMGGSVRLQIVNDGGAGSALTCESATILKLAVTGNAASWARFQILNASTSVNTTVTPQIFDLTQMFGSTIADYVYGLEQATAGAGVAWLSRYIDLGTYHAYDSGSIQSVQATAHVTKDANNNVIGNYPLGSDTLRGIPQLVSNKLQFDGDIKTPDGTIRRKYGIVDLGSLTYTGDSGGFVLSASIGAKVQTAQAVMAKIICSKYPTIMQSQLSGSDKCVYGLNWGNGIGFRDSAYNTPAAFKTAMSGVYLVYELATETTESSTAYQKIQTIDADGTESFTTSSPVPVGHETQTPDNILAALNWLGE